MAMIDYGAVVIKNGKVVNKNQFFMNMLEAVGWTDKKRVRYEDCNCFTDPDPMKAESDCDNCTRAKFKTVNSSVDGEYKIAIEDCHGNPLPDCTRYIDHNHFAYVGDQHLTIAFYKYIAVILVDGKKEWYFWHIDDGIERNCKSRRCVYGGVNIHIKELANAVHYMSLTYRGDHYNIIFGYGIDSSPKTWHRIKDHYLGKAVARKVDNLYRRLLGEDFN